MRLIFPSILDFTISFLCFNFRSTILPLINLLSRKVEGVIVLISEILTHFSFSWGKFSGYYCYTSDEDSKAVSSNGVPYVLTSSKSSDWILISTLKALGKKLH